MSFTRRLIPKFDDITFKPEPVINWDIPLISFSQIQMYNACPHKWKLRYVDKIKLEKYNIHLLYGTALHQTIQMYIHYIFNVSVKEADALNLDDILRDYMIDIYSENEDKPEVSMDITYEDMLEYHTDGVKCLEWLKRNRSKLFSSRKYKLIGIEYPIYTILEDYNVGFSQKLDIVLQDTHTKKYLILDLKTAKKSWNDYKKKDPVIKAQLLFYKIYFSKVNKIPLENIDVSFYIFKREVPDPEMYDFPVKSDHLQRVTFPDGKISLKRAEELLYDFLSNCFDVTGKPLITEHKRIKGRNNFNCTYCQYDSEEYCEKSKRE